MKSTAIHGNGNGLGKHLAYGCALSVMAAGCSATGQLPSPVVDTAGELSTQMCRVTAPPHVVASRVFVPEGVDVETQSRGFAIHFAQTKSRCMTLHSPLASGPFAASDKSTACPEKSDDNEVTSDAETMLASESGDAQVPHILLGVMTYDVPLAPGRNGVGSTTGIAWHLFQPPPSVGSGGEGRPKLVSLGHERFLLLWVEGGSEKHQLRAEALAGWGNAVGPAIDVSSPEMDVVGRPGAAVGPDGEGVVAFLNSGAHGFDLMATPIACNHGAVLQADAALPSAGTVVRR